MQTSTTTTATTVPANTVYNTNNNNNNNNNGVSAIWKIAIILVSLLVFGALIIIHAAYYLYVRNMANNALNAGYTGWSAQTPIFFNGVSEFIPLGFLIVPLVLLSIAFLGRWFDLASCVVALVFACIDFVVILFGTVGVIIVHALNNNNPNNNNSSSSDSSNDFHGNYCHRHLAGIFPNAFCKAQNVLVAGMVILLFAQLLVLFLATRAARHAKRAWLNTNQANVYNYNNYNPAVGSNAAVYPPAV